MAAKEEILCNLFLMKVGRKAEVLGEKRAPRTALPDLGIEPGSPRRLRACVTARPCIIRSTSELQTG
jgi:hypothetical protein